MCKVLQTILAMTAILGVAAAAIAAESLSDSEWNELKRQAKERQRLAIYDNDSDDAVCFGTSTAVTPENYLARRTSYLAKYPIDTIVCNVTYGCFDQVVYPTQAGHLLDFDWRDWNPESTIQNIVPALVEQGANVLELQLAFAKEHGIEFFAGVRVNDVHDVIDKPEKPVPFFSKWKRENPQLMLGPKRKSPGPHAGWSGMDFAHQEVRDKFVAIIAEIAEKYPVDGISIDLQRTCWFFQSAGRGEQPSKKEIALLSDMFRKCRQATEYHGRRRGKPILLAIRGLDDVGYSLAVGFDWEGLMKEGLFDIFFAGGTIHLQPWRKSVELCHKYGVKCYASIDEALCGFKAPRLPRTAPESYYARILGAFQGGVDGIYYFNLFSEHYASSVMLGGPEKYRLRNKRYHLNPTTLWPPNYVVENGERFNAFPLLSPRFKRVITAGCSLEFALEFGDDLSALSKAGVKVAMTASLIGQNPGKVSVSSNGVVWKTLSVEGDTATYEVPLEALRPGMNHVALKNLSATDIEVEDVCVDLVLKP